MAKKSVAKKEQARSNPVVEEDLFPNFLPDPDQYVGNKTGNHIYEIPLDQIRPAPWNPPARMDSKAIQELAESISQHGQQIPGLLRPLEFPLAIPGDDHLYKQVIKYELVFGHRRYAALQLKNGCAKPFKAFIRSMTEEEAMIFSGIENLQRQGFSDIEEAEFFRTAGQRYGESAVKMLAEKLSVSEKYIRKRVEILGLPELALELWREGTWHVGHMKQLLRLGEISEVEAFLNGLPKMNFGYRRITWKDLRVYRLKEIIDRRAIPLGSGKFAKDDCKLCRKNTQVQLTLFGGDQAQKSQTTHRTHTPKKLKIA